MKEYYDEMFETPVRKQRKNQRGRQSELPKPKKVKRKKSRNRVKKELWDKVYEYEG